MNSELVKTVELLNNDAVIAYPTETIWGIGCKANSLKAIKKIYQIKQREKNKPLLVLVDSLEMIKEFVEKISTMEEELLQSSIPTTVIIENIINFPTEIKGPNKSLAFRITKNDFCKQVIHQTGVPLISTSANISGQPAAKKRDELDERLIAQLDYVVQESEAGNLSSEKNAKQEQKPSRIVKVEKGKTIVIRA